MSGFGSPSFSSGFLGSNRGAPFGSTQTSAPQQQQPGSAAPFSTFGTAGSSSGFGGFLPAPQAPSFASSSASSFLGASATSSASQLPPPPFSGSTTAGFGAPSASSFLPPTPFGSSTHAMGGTPSSTTFGGASGSAAPPPAFASPVPAAGFVGTSGFGASTSSATVPAFGTPTTTFPAAASTSSAHTFATSAPSTLSATATPFVPSSFSSSSAQTLTQHNNNNPFAPSSSTATASAGPQQTLSFGVSSNVVSNPFASSGFVTGAASSATAFPPPTVTATAALAPPWGGATAAGGGGGGDWDMGGGNSSPTPFAAARGISPQREASMDDETATALATAPASASHPFQSNPFRAAGTTASDPFRASSSDPTTGFAPAAPWPGAASVSATTSAMSSSTVFPFGPSHSAATAAASLSDGGDDDHEVDATTSRHPSGFATSAPSAAASPQRADDDQEQRDKLERLRAKLEEKKRKLQERQQQQQQQQRPGRNASPIPAATSSSGSRRTNSPPNELAQRNALRFAAGSAAAASSRGGDANSNNSTHRFLPDDLKDQASAPRPAAAAYSSQVAPTEREDLAAAVSLVGTCPFMCPEEELLRRQREGDIQLLELPHPDLYGPRTTLRDTAVKRFRRSAADYKLDVPEWVRPPDVLERVCSYLEEYVMERDRQGPDPRFPQNGTPPSLDVYQFIWDRTRMVRKDFILQNYVGTGGSCDARAVRCHERIARWHAMCEHQLSHIPDFVKAQSQQNIQELGQTMKTLNQYYDDALGRATVEVPDDTGSETLHHLDGITHGCLFDVVQGKHPVDYDGTVLDNELNPAAIASRRIGKQAAASPSHGTSEPEMRGLYIVLTIDNDGGMEVLKYAAHLYQLSPEVYHSKPVQLALSIYKAKKEDNYARFFSILRSPETPYLFACIMLKYVELMRKSAFRIMSKTYGGRSKDKNEAIYDAFPLKSLARLLCFETLDEAREACNHYNITVKPTKVRSSSGTTVEEIVFWRQSTFSEPRDPDKGTLIPFPPRKMLRIIEGKLNGATRLAVCRGQLSGDSNVSVGAIGLTSVPIERQVSIVDPIVAQDTGTGFNNKLSGQDAKFEKLRKRQMELLHKEAKEDALREEEAAQRRKQEEELRLAEREKELAIQECKRQDIARRQQQEVEERQRLERLRIEAERERKRFEQEQEAARQQAIEADRLRKLEEEKAKIALENVRREKERKRKVEEARLREIENERRRLEAEKAELLRREEEAKQREAQLRELEAQRRRREEERRIEQQWTVKYDESLKRLLWGLWQRKYPRRLSIQHLALNQTPDVKAAAFASNASVQLQSVSTSSYAPRPPDLRSVLETLLKSQMLLNLSDRVMELIQTAAHHKKDTILFTVSVYIPFSSDFHQRKLCELVLLWISSCLGVNQVSSAVGETGEVRVAVVDGTNLKGNAPTDVAMIVLPPPLDDATADSQLEEAFHSIVTDVDSSVASVILSLCEPPAGRIDPTAKLATHFEQCMVVRNTEVECNALKDALSSASDLVASALVATAFDHAIPSNVMDRYSATQLGFRALRATILADDDCSVDGHLLQHAYISLGCLVDVLDELGRNQEDVLLTNWPNDLFSYDGRVVADYFGKGIHLPLDWRNTLRAEIVEPYISDLCAMLSGSIDEVMGFLLFGASLSEIEENQRLLERRQFRQYLLRAIGYREHSIELDDEEPCIYLPRKLVGTVFAKVVERFVAISEASKPKVHYQALQRLHSANARDPTSLATNFIETTDAPPEGTPIQVQPIQQDSRKRELAVDGDSTDLECDSSNHEYHVRQKRRRSAGSGWSNPSTPDNRSSASHRKLRSRNIKDSKAFTRRLKDLARGGTQDLLVGHVPLSILLQGVPSLGSESELRQKLRELA